MSSSKPSSDSTRDALMNRRALRNHIKMLEHRQSTITAELDYVRSEIAVAVSMLATVDKPQVNFKLSDSLEKESVVPMSADDVDARLTPSPVKRALKASWENVQQRKLSQTMPQPEMTATQSTARLAPGGARARGPSCEQSPVRNSVSGTHACASWKAEQSYTIETAVRQPTE